jgi:circadian clock protein KaiC
MENDVLIQPTGIEELDILLNGGIPEGHVILLSGKAGCGKTILATQWLFAGYKHFNEAGIFVTVTESIHSIIKNIKGLSFFDGSVISPVQIHFTDLRTIIDSLNFDQELYCKKYIDELLIYFDNFLSASSAKRLVIDSLSAFTYMLKDVQTIRYFIFKLGNLLANADCTAIILSEVSEDKSSTFSVEEYISDGIIRLDYDYVKDEMIRNIKIHKMRGRRFDASINTFKIADSGVKIFLKYSPSLSYNLINEKIPTGIKGLDKMCEGGLFKGSATLIVGSTGTGKTIMSLSYVMEGAKRGETCLYVSFEESRQQLIRTAKSFGWDIEHFEKSGFLTFLCLFPDVAYPVEQFLLIKQIIEDKQIKRCVIDSISSVGNVLTSEELIDFATRLISYLKWKNITTYITSTMVTLLSTETITEAQISYLTDNIILLKYVEARGVLNLVIVVLKTRSSNRDKKLRVYSITHKGIVIGEALHAFEGIMSGYTRKIGQLSSEKLKEEFVKKLGPMGLQVYDELFEIGITEETLVHYIDSLVSDGILKSNIAKEFIDNSLHILKT